MDPVKYDETVQFAGMHLAENGFMVAFTSTSAMNRVTQAASEVQLQLSAVYNIYRGRGWGYRDSMKVHVFT